MTVAALCELLELTDAPDLYQMFLPSNRSPGYTKLPCRVSEDDREIAYFITYGC